MSALVALRLGSCSAICISSHTSSARFQSFRIPSCDRGWWTRVSAQMCRRGIDQASAHRVVTQHGRESLEEETSCIGTAKQQVAGDFDAALGLAAPMCCVKSGCRVKAVNYDTTLLAGMRAARPV